ncbi:Gfo/Idh/MocA family oxidoreductase [Streptomyces sp. NPDC001586]|uniref:Gfo/Idh/MocA family oxidoreductase n=1 Tax=Streptomyces sp. NPDC001586 TaxID=3154387 RepID=UPI003324EF9A
MSYQRDYERRLRVGLVGLGGHGYRTLLPALNNLPVRLSAVCDVDAALADRTARQYGAVPYTCQSDMLAGQALDAVLLAAPPQEHPALAVEALGHGLHVWMEKPPAVRAADLDPVIAARGDRVVVVGLKKVFMPAARKALELLAMPGTGRLTSLYARYALSVPESGGELPARRTSSHWLAEGCHPLSLLLAAGGPVEAVDVHRGGLGDCLCVLRFAGGALGVLQMSENLTMSQPFEQYTFVAEHGTVEILNGSRVTFQRGIPYEYGVTTGFAPEGTDGGLTTWEPQHSRAALENRSDFVQGIHAELDHFCRSVLRGSPATLGTLEFARQVMEVYEAALLAAP